MALTFSKIMTAYLAQSAITGFFNRIVRHRTPDVLKETVFPFLSVAVNDDVQTDAAGDAKRVQAANYGVIVANRLDAGQAQDEAVEEMVSVLKGAAAAFHYSTSGYAAEIDLQPWAADEAEAGTPGAKVWVDTGLNVRYRPV